MHEMAIARSIVELVEEQASRDAFSFVRSVRVRIGALSSVEPRALAFGFEVAARGTVAQGATLLVDSPSGQGWCTHCRVVLEVRSRGEGCPRCGGALWLAQGGEELRVIDLEVE